MKGDTIYTSSGEELDIEKTKITISIKPSDIDMTDNADEGITSGNIISLIYKGDHYSYVVRTVHGHELFVDDEYLWNLGDTVGLIMPEDKMTFTVKK